MKKAIIVYSIVLGGGAFILQWLEYQYAVRMFSTELYIVAIAVGFTVLGVWVGHRLTGKKPAAEFKRNDQALSYLGISDREYQVLELLAEGHSNKEIAADLFVSPNTVKTHLAHLYEKLEVSRRTQAVTKAKSLNIIP